jgi:transposase
VLEKAALITLEKGYEGRRGRTWIQLTKRHRLNPRGNRQLNHALHIAAITQIRNNTPGRAYYRRTLAENNSQKEALRALKRRISDAVYRRLTADAKEGAGRTTRDDAKAA